jgi:hypothetical protein
MHLTLMMISDGWHHFEAGRQADVQPRRRAKKDRTPDSNNLSVTLHKKGFVGTYSIPATQPWHKLKVGTQIGRYNWQTVVSRGKCAQNYPWDIYCAVH